MKDLTGGSPIKLIIYFTLPIIAGHLLQLMYTVVNAYIVGQTLGVNSFAAVGSSITLFHLLFGFTNQVAIGSAIVTSQYFGAKDMEGVRKSFSTGITLVLLVSLIIMVLFIPTSGFILRIMRTPQEIIGEAREYITVLLYGITASMMFSLFAGVLRGVGDSKTPVIFLSLTNLLNIMLDYFFILVLKTGVGGVAFATVISQVTSCICCAVYILKKHPSIRPSIHHFKAFRTQLRPHLRLGIPMGCQHSVVEIGNIVVQFMVNGLGVTAIAAVVTAQRIRAIGMMPIFSFGATMSYFAAQNFGAGDFDRIKEGVKSGLKITIAIGVLTASVFALLGTSLVSTIVNDAAVIALARDYLVIQCSMLVMLGVLIVLRSTLQGMGIVSAPTYSSITEMCVCVVIAVFLVPAIGFMGVILTTPMAWILASVPLIVAYVKTMKIKSIERV